MLELNLRSLLLNSCTMMSLVPVGPLPRRELMFFWLNLDAGDTIGESKMSSAIP